MPCFTTPKQLYDTCHPRHRIGTSRRGTLSSCLRKIISRLNHFNFRLRPVGSRPSCLTFGVTSACPMFTIWWLTYLARAGLSPAGIIDLARPHTPLIPPNLSNDLKIELYFARSRMRIKFDRIHEFQPPTF